MTVLEATVRAELDLSAGSSEALARSVGCDNRWCMTAMRDYGRNSPPNGAYPGLRDPPGVSSTFSSIQRVLACERGSKMIT